MALGATIYKVELNIADSDRHYYGSHVLTVARHPSETTERMLVRLVAFALNAHDDLAFTKGLSSADEPDIWLKDLTGAVDLWIEVGQPTESRLLKGCSRANQVIVYCHNGHASKLWWDSAHKKLARAKNLKVVYLPIEPIRELENDINRNMTLHVNIQEQEVFISNDSRQVSLTPDVWHDSSG
ncbi:MAG TPA: YaeQ family protein [Orrella sp.]